MKLPNLISKPSHRFAVLSKISVCCLLFLLSGIAANAQTQKVRGIVQDSKGESIPGVSVVVKDNRPSVQQQTWTVFLNWMYPSMLP